MSIFVSDGPNITIPNGTAVSNILKSSELHGVETISLYGPAALDAGHTYTLEVTDDQEATASSTWYTWNNGTADLNPPQANKGVSYPNFAFAAFRIKDSTGNVAADRTWRSSLVWRE